MIKNRARGVPVDSCALMWMHHRRASGTLIKFDEGDYYGHFSRCSAKHITQPARTVGNAGKDGWIEWGGDCDSDYEPVSGLVEVKFRNGFSDKCPASMCYWKHLGDSSDIIAYRVIAKDGV